MRFDHVVEFATGRRGAALGRHRRHGDDGLPGHAPLRAHGELRPGHALRLAGGLGAAAAAGAGGPHGAPGRGLSRRSRGSWWPTRRRWRRWPATARTLGEVMLRGNTLMKGYLKNPAATEEAFRGGWFHTGDLAVWHPDGYIEIKDRSKDVIISGGENISSLEVEEVLYRHPAVMEAAVVARPDETVGRDALRLRHPQARRRRRGRGPDHPVVPRPSGRLQGAEAGGLRAAAQDLDGQDPEVRAAGARAPRGLNWGPGDTALR